MPKPRTGDAAARLAAIVESSDDAIVSTTLGGIITSWNRAATTLFGFTEEEAVGQPIGIIVPAERLDEEHGALARLRAGERIDPFETVRRRKDGSLVEVSLTVSPVKDRGGRMIGASEIGRDIGDRRRLDEALARLAAIVDFSEDAIVSKTLDGTITSWNRAAERLFGYAAREAIGQPIFLIVPADRRQEEMLVLERIRGGGRVEHFETVRRRKDGVLVDVSLTISPVKDRHGRIIGASKIARDISVRKRVERERAAMFEEAKQANRAKDEFLAMLGHELRNPLGAISSAVRLLEPDAPSERAALARDVIVRQSRHLARLVDDLLDVARVMTGKVLLERQPFDLAEVVARHVNSARATGKMHDQTVTVDTLPVWVEADVVRIEQVVGNLVSNALKYTPAGGTIAVSVRPEGGQAVLRVEDSGLGMTRELMARVFDLFVQGERRLDRGQGGLGIGLTLVRRLVELHGGTVEAWSEGPDRGSRFTVRLPAVATPGALDAGNGARTAARGDALRILLIEDNDDARAMLRSLLELDGHRVHEAADGRVGLDLALELRPDVVLIDLGLPGIDGYEVARRIRAADERRSMTLVAITGYGSPDDRERSLLAGFDVHLVKPVDPDLLAGVLSR